MPTSPPSPTPEASAADVLRCSSCGGPVGNEALAAGECIFCGAGLTLPRRPEAKKSARIISKPGEEMVVRVDEGGGIGVERFENIIWDPHAEARSKPRNSGTSPPTTGDTAESTASRLWLGVIVVLMLVIMAFIAVTQAI